MEVKLENDKQKKCLWVGMALIVIMGLFPPWVLERSERKYRGYGEGYEWKSTIEPGPYSWIGNPPGTTYLPNRARTRIGPKFVDRYRLGIQFFLVAAVTAGLIITFGDKKGSKKD